MSTVQVTILPGVPNMTNLRVDGDKVPYPDSTIDMVKVLRERGIEVAFTDKREDRVYVGHKALEVWLPILMVVRDTLVGVEAGLLVELIKSYFAPNEPNDDVLHVEIEVSDPHGRSTRFKGDGKGDQVLSALDAFERQVRDE